MSTPVANNFVGPVISPSSPAGHQVVKTPPPITGANPVPVAQILQTAAPGAIYSETISVQGGVSPYSFSVLTGTLPGGLSLNSSTGVISGTPTTAATYNFTILVTDTNGATGTQPFTIDVVAKSGGNFCVVY